MISSVIKKESLEFLSTLSKNNNRDWFNKHKDEYLAARENIVAFADALLHEMNKHDKIETASGKKSLFRIYKDVRFSKDKTPYNTHWSGAFKRATMQLRGGYYFRIEPGNSYIIGGFWGPDKDDMKRIRENIVANYPYWNALLKNGGIKKTFGTMIGEKLSSAPRGYSKNHRAIDLLRHKQFLLKHEFTDKEVYSSGFVFNVVFTFRMLRPFFDFMSEVLTTDANGVSVFE